ncbi:MAG: hypothetical protein AMS16_05650 [Planctomycetes bacterium DG_58]|nr:MAG: hypothetical protein AMS16_05650 [Planctomycetes bacterium DG_58]
MAFLRAMNDDLVELGVTHKAIVYADDSFLIECKEAERTGLRLIPFGFKYLSYRQGDLTGSSRARMWAWVQGLKQYGLDRYIDGFWVADDVTNDGAGDGHLLRQKVKEYFPHKEIIVSATTGASPDYVKTLRRPYPDQILLQVYPYWRNHVKNKDNSVNEKYITDFVDKRIAAARPQDGFWFSFFGCPDWSVNERFGTTEWHYAPRPGELLGQMKKAWLAGKRGYYGIFTVLWHSGKDGDKPDPWIALYDHNKLMATHDFRRARTYLWYEMREFIDWVHKREAHGE